MSHPILVESFLGETVQKTAERALQVLLTTGASVAYVLHNDRLVQVLAHDNVEDVFDRWRTAPVRERVPVDSKRRYRGVVTGILRDHPANRLVVQVTLDLGGGLGLDDEVLIVRTS